MIAKINQLLQEVEALKAANAEELEALRIKYLSKKGAINDLMADFRNVAAEQKKEVGMRLNELKNKAQEKIAALKEQFESQDTGCDDIDLTRSAYPIELGTRHPLSIVRNEIIDIFARMGFNIADGPEMEEAIYDYGKDILEKLAGENLFPTFVAIGGDYDFVASNGLFMCRLGDNDAERMVTYMNAGYRAVRDFAAKYDKKIKTVFHASKADDVVRLLGRFYTDEYALDFDVLGINYVFDTGHSAYSTLGELSVYMKLIYEKEFMVVGASFPYTNVNADKVFNIYSRMDMITYGSTYSPEVQARMFVDFTIDVLKAGGLGVIAEGGDFLGCELWFAGNPWNKGSNWDNRTFWDKDYRLHVGIDWMKYDYKPFVKRNY